MLLTGVATQAAAEPSPAATAADAPQIAIVIGPGVRVPLRAPEVGSSSLDKDDDGGAPVGSLGATIGWRFSRRAAIGVRGDGSWRHYRSGYWGTISGQRDSYSAVLLDAAVTLLAEPSELLDRRFWFALRLGERFTRLSTSEASCYTVHAGPVMCGAAHATTAWSPAQTMIGVTTGIDVFRAGAERVAVFADASYASLDGWMAGLGLAYHR